MSTADLDAVTQLERAAYAFPWSRQLFADSLQSEDDCHVMLADLSENSAVVVGHAVLTTVLDDATVLNIAVHPDYQRRGLGQQLLQHVLQRALGLGASSCFLEVRPSNQAALALYRAAGFSEVGRRKNYYPADDGAREDALVLRCSLPLVARF